MNIDRREIEETIEELKRTGEYDQYASPEADREHLALVRALRWVIDLTDEEADAELASVPPAPGVADERLAEEIARVMARSRLGPHGRSTRRSSGNSSRPQATHLPGVLLGEDELSVRRGTRSRRLR